MRGCGGHLLRGTCFAPRALPCPAQALHLPTPAQLPPQYATHPEPIVADSCIVALDMLEFEQSGSFQYADAGQAAAAEGQAAVTAGA